MELPVTDSPAEIWELRKEFHSLKRQLRSGQQKLRSSVRLLHADTRERKNICRSASKRHQRRTSTPMVSDGPLAVSAIRELATPVSKVATPREHSHLGRRSSGRTARTGRARSRPSRDSVTTESSMAYEPIASSSTETSCYSPDGSPALRRPLKRRSERLHTRSPEEKENVSVLRDQRETLVDTGSSDGKSSETTGDEVMTPRPKSILLTPGGRLRGKTPNRVAFVDRLNQMSVKRRRVSAKDRSLLGYDWIAGVLESGSDYASRSDEYFEELRQFRRTHRDDCIHETMTDLSATPMDSTLPPEREDVDVSSPLSTHKCIHNYNLNSRLFPVPLHQASDGESLCAICRDRKRAQPTRMSPAYIRVSIPRSTLVSPYKLRSHRRRSYDPTDSLGLSQHCLTGWQTSKPSMMPTAGGIALKSALNPSTSHPDFNPTGEDMPPTRRLSKMSKRTQQLMNRSLALQLDAQNLSRRNNLSGSRPAPATSISRKTKTSIRKKRK